MLKCSFLNQTFPGHLLSNCNPFPSSLSHSQLYFLNRVPQCILFEIQQALGEHFAPQVAGPTSQTRLINGPGVQSDTRLRSSWETALVPPKCSLLWAQGAARSGSSARGRWNNEWWPVGRVAAIRATARPCLAPRRHLWGGSASWGQQGPNVVKWPPAWAPHTPQCQTSSDPYHHCHYHSIDRRGSWGPEQPNNLPKESGCNPPICGTLETRSHMLCVGSYPRSWRQYEQDRHTDALRAPVGPVRGKVSHLFCINSYSNLMRSNSQAKNFTLYS